MKKQAKCDRMPARILDRLRRILPFADMVVNEVNFEEIDKIIPRMFEVMGRATRFSCMYIRGACRWLPSGFSRFS